MESPAPSGEYVVVARRYRPQQFSELLGQEHVAKALSGAIASGRVGHAYLFTGARGVGKTSAARILAKALNCVEGASGTPCNQCDICQAISAGGDVDVLEIDGASNRGIDEIRQLRQSVNIRPSRARFKVYIIDEVHMLTREAFNALLKTLEEPPEHVKFIFCTTEPEKVPITVLSRCQRFDFAGIRTPSIVQRLRQIVDAEGVKAEDEALELLARRAAGSMRDSQSLLEQLLAFGGETITANEVHRMLGTAGDHLVASLVEKIATRDAAAAMTELDAALSQGVDVGQLIEQLLGHLRDLMAASVGAPAEVLLYVAPGQRDALLQTAADLGCETILAMLQILDQTLSRMRVSTGRRTLAELALVRMCKLGNLEQLARLIAGLQYGQAVPSATAGGKVPPSRPATSQQSARKKKSEEPLSDASERRESVVQGAEEPSTPPSAMSLDVQSAPAVWKQALALVEDMVADHAGKYSDLAIPAPNRLVIHFHAQYSFSKSLCERAEHARKLQDAVAKVAGQNVRLEFALDQSAAAQQTETPRPVAPQARLREKAEHPLVRKASELFGAQAVRVEEREK